MERHHERKNRSAAAAIILAFLCSCGVTGAERDNHGLSYLEDRGGVMTLEEVIGRSERGEFLPIRGFSKAFGFTRAAIWFRMKLPSVEAEDKRTGTVGSTFVLEMYYPTLDSIDVYIPMRTDGGGAGGYIHRQGGVEHFGNRTAILNTWVFRIPSRAAAGEFCYFRARCKTSIMYMEAALFEAGDYISREARDKLYYGLFLGIMLAMAAFNLFIYLSLREVAYIHYVAYITAMTLYQFTVHGLIFMYLPVAGAIYGRVLLGTLGMTLLFSLLFTRRFLDIKSTLPRLDRVMKFLIGTALLSCILGIAGFTSVANQLTNITGGLGPLFVIALAVLRYRQGFSLAAYFLTAFALLTMGSIVWILAGHVTLPFNYRYFFLGTTAGEALLLSLALGHKLRLLKTSHERLDKSVIHYRAISTRDDLTSLYNRRYLHERLREETGRATARNEKLSVIMLDVDSFKIFNDNYGHLEGDRLLKTLADVMIGTAGETMTPCRFGGEEFTMVIPAVDGIGAAETAERLRCAFIDAQKDANHPASTISLGVAEYVAGDTPESLLQRADEALYRAKSMGKDRWVLA